MASGHLSKAHAIALEQIQQGAQSTNSKSCRSIQSQPPPGEKYHHKPRLAEGPKVFNDALWKDID